MPSDRSRTGEEGEAAVVAHLERLGYRVLERNLRNYLGEIDIIAEQKGVICFIEVRARQGVQAHENAAASVDRRKQARLSRLALSFLKEKGLLERRARFDVACVSLLDNSVLLLQDAFCLSDQYA